jgi:hypothetical protein
MVGSAKNGFYAGLIPMKTFLLSGLKPPQRGGVLNPLANKYVKIFTEKALYW